MAYRLAPQAEADLEDVAFYIFLESGSLEIADRLVQSITERFDLLDAYPRAGPRGSIAVDRATKILNGGTWYPQVIGLEPGSGTDKVAGQVARFFTGGVSDYVIVFQRSR